MYRHPSPASTNPHWQTEIEAGPHLVSRGRKKTPTNTNREEEKSKPRKRTVTQSSNDSGLPSSVDLSSIGESRDGRVDSKLHFQQFQRDNEQGPLTVTSVERLSSNTSDGFSSRSNITRPVKALMVDEVDYIHHRNPQINDLHPATVTKIASKQEAKWLMAPPPTADFMEGRDRSSRTRSDSGGSSRLSGRSEVPLSRDMSQRILERRMRSGDTPLVPTLSRESTSQGSGSPTGQNHDRDNIDEKDFALDDSPSSRAGRMKGSEASADTVIRNPDLAPEPYHPRRLASKPQLSTIASSTGLSSDAQDEVPKARENIRHSDESIPERDRLARRSPLVMKDDSLKVLQDLAPNSAIFRSHVVSSQHLTGGATRRERQESDQASEGASDMLESWSTMDFSSPDWIHEHTKREVKHRWSMDI